MSLDFVFAKPLISGRSEVLRHDVGSHFAFGVGQSVLFYSGDGAAINGTLGSTITSNSFAYSLLSSLEFSIGAQLAISRNDFFFVNIFGAMPFGIAAKSPLLSNWSNLSSEISSEIAKNYTIDARIGFGHVRAVSSRVLFGSIGGFDVTYFDLSSALGEKFDFDYNRMLQKNLGVSMFIGARWIVNSFDAKSQLIVDLTSGAGLHVGGFAASQYQSDVGFRVNFGIGAEYKFNFTKDWYFGLQVRSDVNAIFIPKNTVATRATSLINAALTDAQKSAAESISEKNPTAVKNALGFHTINNNTLSNSLANTMGSNIVLGSDVAVNAVLEKLKAIFSAVEGFSVFWYSKDVGSIGKIVDSGSKINLSSEGLFDVSKVSIASFPPKSSADVVFNNLGFLGYKGTYLEKYLLSVNAVESSTTTIASFDEMLFVRNPAAGQSCTSLTSCLDDLKILARLDSHQVGVNGPIGRLLNLLQSANPDPAALDAAKSDFILAMNNNKAFFGKTLDYSNSDYNTAISDFITKLNIIKSGIANKLTDIASLSNYATSTNMQNIVSVDSFVYSEGLLAAVNMLTEYSQDSYSNIKSVLDKAVELRSAATDALKVQVLYNNITSLGMRADDKLSLNSNSLKTWLTSSDMTLSSSDMTLSSFEYFTKLGKSVNYGGISDSNWQYIYDLADNFASRDSSVTFSSVFSASKNGFIDIFKGIFQKTNDLIGSGNSSIDYAQRPFDYIPNLGGQPAFTVFESFVRSYSAAYYFSAKLNNILARVIDSNYVVSSNWGSDFTEMNRIVESLTTVDFSSPKSSVSKVAFKNTPLAQLYYSSSLPLYDGLSSLVNSALSSFLSYNKDLDIGIGDELRQASSILSDMKTELSKNYPEMLLDILDNGKIDSLADYAKPYSGLDYPFGGEHDATKLTNLKNFINDSMASEAKILSYAAMAIKDIDDALERIYKVLHDYNPGISIESSSVAGSDSSGFISSIYTRLYFGFSIGCRF